MTVLNLKFFFSIQQLANQRSKFQHKICFKDSLSYLKLKTTPSIAISGRLYRDGNFLRLFKILQKSFFTHLIPKTRSMPHNNEFKNLFNQYKSFCDLNRVLFWKISLVNSLFSLKKLKNKRILFYLRPERRVVLVLLWLKNLIKLRKGDYANLSPKLFTPLFSFISSNKNSNEIFTLKLRIYKMRLVRG